jgi:NADPH-dependent 2,4-dienoyl-CoA reductase/sulfur reductase-like enzyme
MISTLTPSSLAMPERVRFTLDGRPAEAEGGTSLLAALWNAGRRAVRTSVSGEARGPLCGMGACFECRVTIDGEPHRRACLATVRKGMDVVIPRDAGWTGPEESAVSAPADPPRSSVGHQPRGFASGPGQDGAPRGDKAEVVVVGGGPAGIAAAVHAAETGARTLLLDEQARLGGQIWRGEAAPAAREWLLRLSRSGTTLLAGATVVDAPGPNELLVERDGLPVRVAFESLVLATGARELFLPFPGWTLPGVVGVGGAQALLKAGARFEGLRVVVAGSGPLLLAVAAGLKQAGARIVGIAEQAPFSRLATLGAGLWSQPRRIAEGLGYAATLRGVPWRAGTWVREALGDEGVLRVVLAGSRAGEEWECDVLACGFGLVPNLELPRLLGCETTTDRVVVDASQRTSRDGVFATGELCGIAGVEHALATGAIAGLAAAGRGTPRWLARRRARETGFAGRLARAFALRDELRSLPRPDTTVCRCEDVPLGRLAMAASAREAKLLTRAGMGACQGRVCGSALGFLRGFAPDSVRPPLAPVPVAVLAGEEERL